MLGINIKLFDVASPYPSPPNGDPVFISDPTALLDSWIDLLDAEFTTDLSRALDRHGVYARIRIVDDGWIAGRRRCSSDRRLASCGSGPKTAS